MLTKLFKAWYQVQSELKINFMSLVKINFIIANFITYVTMSLSGFSIKCSIHHIKFLSYL
jgi:hypothetical protein